MTLDSILLNYNAMHHVVSITVGYSTRDKELKNPGSNLTSREGLRKNMYRRHISLCKKERGTRCGRKYNNDTYSYGQDYNEFK